MTLLLDRLDALVVKLQQMSRQRWAIAYEHDTVLSEAADAITELHVALVAAKVKLAGAYEALEKTVWRQRTQFPDDPYCELCGAGQKWASEHGHEPECALARKEGA